MNGELPGWVGPLVATVVALVGAAGLIIVRKVRGPVAIQDLWAENRKLREEMETLDQKVDRLFQASQMQLTVNRIMGDGFDALSNYVERDAAQSGRPPAFTKPEHTAIERARALRSDDTQWTTHQPRDPSVTR